MIYDCFTYFNEVDVLDLRMRILQNTVDYFVVVEANETFTGKKKPQNFYDATSHWDQQRYIKIIYVPIEFPDGMTDPWEREVYQRNQTMLSDMEDTDIVFISDVDEIVDPRFVKQVEKEYKNGTLDTPLQFDVTQYFWSFDWEVPAHCNQGARPAVAQVRDITTPQELRAAELERVPRSGWHFSFLGHHLEGFAEKVEAFSHTEVDLDYYKDQELIRRRAKIGIDPFDRFPLKRSDRGALPQACYDEAFAQYWIGS